MFAPVMVKGDLTILPRLIQQQFGLQFENLYGACLASQFVFTLSDISDIPPQKLANAVKPETYSSGLTFEELFDIFDNKVLQIGTKKVKFALSLETHTIEEAIEQVKQGQPVTTIISGYFGGTFDYLGKDGIVKAIDPGHALDNTDQFHALLIVGYDATEKTVIFREMRSKYAFKGFLKIPLALIQKNKGHFKFISTIVDDFREIK